MPKGGQSRPSSGPGRYGGGGGQQRPQPGTSGPGSKGGGGGEGGKKGK